MLTSLVIVLNTRMALAALILMFFLKFNFLSSHTPSYLCVWVVCITVPFDNVTLVSTDGFGVHLLW